MRATYWLAMRRARCTALLTLAVAAGAFPAAAAAQQDGVTIDPGSPSAKEYAIPLENARRGATPGEDPAAPIAQGSRDSAAFGAGITPKAGSSAKRTRSAQRSGKRNHPASKQQTDLAGSVVQAAASRPGAPAGSTGTTALYIGGALVLLAAGAGGGLLLRRHR